MVRVAYQLMEHAWCMVSGASLAATRSVSVGVLALEEENEKGLDLGVTGPYIALIAWAMVGIGVLYFVMVRPQARVKGPLQVQALDW